MDSGGLATAWGPKRIAEDAEKGKPRQDGISRRWPVRRAAEANENGLAPESQPVRFHHG
jgi:hypothetical protein